MTPLRWGCAGLAGAGLLIGAVVAKTAYPTADVLLATSETVIGQPIVYPAGPAEATAQGSAHNGVNTGADAVRILVVSIGAEGVANTVPLPD